MNLTKQNILKILSSTFVGVTLILGLILVYIFSLSKSKITTQIENNLENQSLILVKNLNLDEYEKLITNPLSFDYDVNYKRVIFPLQELHSLLKDKNKFVYTVFEKEGKIVFGLDTTLIGDSDNDGVSDHAPLFSEYEDAPNDLKSMFKSSTLKTSYLSSPYSDKWGTFISYYYPLVNKSKFLGYIAIDMNVDVYMKDIKALQNNLIVLFLILEFFVGILCYAVFRMMSLETKKNQLEKELELTQISKLAALGEMSSVLTHEINNPLQSISGFAEMIKLMSQKPDKMKQVQDYSDKILGACSTIQNIIKSTKSLVRNDSNDDFEVKKFNNILAETEYLFKDKLTKFNIKYSSEVPDYVEINCVPSQIQMSLMNLVNNSVFSIKDNPEKFIKIKFSEDDKNYHFFVIDSGAPLSKEIQEKIKSKFFSTKKNGEGSGVGLATIRRIIKKHKGDFKYNDSFSTVCFQISLPKIAKASNCSENQDAKKAA